MAVVPGIKVIVVAVLSDVGKTFPLENPPMLAEPPTQCQWQIRSICTFRETVSPLDGTVPAHYYSPVVRRRRIRQI